MSHFIDHIFYINLEHRTDRKEEIESELDSYGLQYERFNAFYTPPDGFIGCAQSHLAVLKMARERGYKNILIVEDDFKFVVSKEEFEDKLNTLFTSGLDFDICMISYIVQKSEDVNEFPFVKRVLNGQTTSGYIIREQFYDKLIGLYEWANPLLANTKQHWNYACDTVWKRLQPTSKWYCMTDRFGIQRPSYSDCSNSFGNYES
jgi:glycosyl transferase family 25